jgi:hypothetical protein
LWCSGQFHFPWKVIKLSGKTHHPIAVSSQSDTVSGQVFEITAEELAQSDKYEVDADNYFFAKTN